MAFSFKSVRDSNVAGHRHGHCSVQSTIANSGACAVVPHHVLVEEPATQKAKSCSTAHGGLWFRPKQRRRFQAMLVEVLRIMLLHSSSDCLDVFENAMEQPQYKAGGTILNRVFLARVCAGMEIKTIEGNVGDVP